MRRAATSTTPEPGRTREDRDAAVEALYQYPQRVPGLSTLAYVAANVDELVRAFVEFETDAFSPHEPEDVTLRSFEAKRFGNPLEPSAHAILRRAVTQARLHGAPPKRHAKVPPRRAGEDAEAYLTRICEANAWPIAEGGVQRMPKARQTRRDVDEQLGTLREQAAEIGGDA